MLNKRPRPFAASLLASLAIAATSTAQTPLPAITPSRDLDVPFIVTAPVVTRAMLEMAKVTKNDFVIDLGSGDGRIIFRAAQAYGARGLGVEIDPRLVETALEDTQKLKLAGQVHFRVQDLFETDLSQASVITMYLLPEVNLQLRDKLLRLKPGTRVVSHDWDMGDWPPDQMRVVANPEKSLGREKTSKVFLWVIPAEVAGRWCGVIPLRSDPASKSHAPRSVSLHIAQRYQQLDGKFFIASANGENKNAAPVSFHAKITANRFVMNVDGRNMEAELVSDGRLRLRMDADAVTSTLLLKRSNDCADSVGVNQ